MVELDTGIRRDRLRVWERCQGFPRPVRIAKGEGSYPEEQLQRRQRSRRLLYRGMRPAKLLPESSEQLNKTAGYLCANGRLERIRTICCRQRPGLFFHQFKYRVDTDMPVG